MKDTQDFPVLTIFQPSANLIISEQEVLNVMHQAQTMLQASYNNLP